MPSGSQSLWIIKKKDDGPVLWAFFKMVSWARAVFPVNFYLTVFPPIYSGFGPDGRPGKRVMSIGRRCSSRAGRTDGRNHFKKDLGVNERFGKSKGSGCTTFANTSYNSVLLLILRKFPTFNKPDHVPENPNGFPAP